MSAQPHVTIYTQPDCAQCDQTKKVLTKRGVDFVEVGLDEPVPGNADGTVREWVKQYHGFTSAPVVHNLATGEWWAGFKIDKLLGLQRV